MKKVSILLIILSAICFSSFAQIDVANNTIVIKDYENTTALNLQNNNVILKNGDRVDSFPVLQIGVVFTLKNLKDDSAKFYQTLRLSPEMAKEELINTPGANRIEKLLTLTANSKDKKFVLQGKWGISHNNGDSPVVEEGGQPVQIAKEEPAETNWLGFLMTGLVAIVGGFFLGRLIKPKAIEEAVPEQSVEDFTQSIQSTVAAPLTEKQESKLLELKKELASLKEKNNLITDKTQRLIAGDNSYYTAVFDQIILPLQTALNDGNEKDVVKYTNLAMVHFSSITRVKIRKKQNYDEANIQLITGNSSQTSSYPTIDNTTPIDKIPANLRVLIDILKKSGVNDLDDTIIKGYKLKNI